MVRKYGYGGLVRGKKGEYRPMIFPIGKGGYGGLVKTKAGHYQPIVFLIGKVKARKK